jgi:4-amino-4-deoxy-L-arabinose transferase-like glycosyltransferase
MNLNQINRACWLIFLLGVVVIGGTVAGPGLTWDEPAYRGSQVLVQEWWRELLRTHDLSLLGRDQIDHYWEFNRFGPNFHPPMASYFNLATYTLFGWFIDDLSARRLASAFQFSALAAILCRFLGKRWGLWPGVFAGLSLLFMPRLVGDAHVVGTDVTMLFFWTITALLFWISLDEPCWRWRFGAAAGCLFLTKFSGLVLIVPLALWFVPILWSHRQWLGKWISLSLQLVIPLIPAAIAVIGGEKLAAKSGMLASGAKFVFEHDRLFSLTLLWPTIRLWMFRRPADWPRVLEIPFAALAVAPVVAVALNPSWWHETLHGLARYFDLNLHREGKLPNIGVFYLGERYNYSLPWHNGWVLLAVTVPFGVLFLGLFGVWSVFRNRRREALGLFVLLQSLTLIVFRMFPTPAHDGVRLFLPTFLFFAALAAYGAMKLAQGRPRWWVVLFVVGPIFSATEWACIHPLELSYYNIGLRNAFNAGFEATYWYDAVTPRFLKQVNETLPPNAGLLVQVDPLINPEVLFSLQAMGELRGDINLNPSPNSRDNWILLLTHSSKAVPFTKALYAVTDGQRYEHDGVRLVSIIDPKEVSAAFALLSMATVRGQMHIEINGTTRIDPLQLFEPAFRATVAEWRSVFKAIKDGTSVAGNAAELLRHCQTNPFAAHYLPLILREHPESAIAAAGWLARSPEDVRMVLTSPGYLPDSRFGRNWNSKNGGFIDQFRMQP